MPSFTTRAFVVGAIITFLVVGGAAEIDFTPSDSIVARRELALQQYDGKASFTPAITSSTCSIKFQRPDRDENIYYLTVMPKFGGPISQDCWTIDSGSVCEALGDCAITLTMTTSAIFGDPNCCAPMAIANTGLESEGWSSANCLGG